MITESCLHFYLPKNLTIFTKKSSLKRALRGAFLKNVKNYRIFEGDKNRIKTCNLAQQKPDFLLYFNRDSFICHSRILSGCF